MTLLLLSLLLLGIIAAIFGLFARQGKEQPVEPAPTCSTCTGEDTRCEQECLLEAAVNDIVYYDDEQLDKYQNRPSDSYTQEEINDFAEVLYTLQPTDAKGWNRSLILRHINIPDQLKDDLITLLSDY